MALNAILLQSLAASATVTSPAVAVDDMTKALAVRVMGEYGAEATTSGLKITLKVSADGTTFTNSNIPAVTLLPAATVIGTAMVNLPLVNEPFRKDAAPIKAVEVVVQNLDATNAATICATATPLHQADDNV